MCFSGLQSFPSLSVDGIRRNAGFERNDVVLPFPLQDLGEDDAEFLAFLTLLAADPADFFRNTLRS